MRAWPVLLIAFALEGCAGVVIVNDPIHNPVYVYGDEYYAARGGSIRVEVNGETFGVPREQFATLVVDRMRAAFYRHDLFTREASRATDPRYKIVMMFDPDPAVSGYALCAAAQPFQPVPHAPGQTTVLLAAFCGGAEVISETSGRVIGGVTGAEDPKFAELVGKVANSIFPKTDNRQSGSGSSIGF